MEYPQEQRSSQSAALLQMSASELCTYLDLQLLRQESMPQYAVDPIVYHLVSQNDEFFDDDSWDESNVDNCVPKAFSCSSDVFHVSIGKRVSRLSMEQELGIAAG